MQTVISEEGEHLQQLERLLRNADRAIFVRNFKEAFLLYVAAEKLINQCNPRCGHIYFRLGALHKNGYGCIKDEVRASTYFSLANKHLPDSANQGDAEAQYDLGCIYENGYGVAVDYQVALKYYFLSAEQGHCKGQYNLGCVYDNGHGTEQSRELAIKYWTLAAEGGHSRAQFNLACTYDESENWELSFKYYKLAAEAGHHTSQLQVAKAYESGKGVKQDKKWALDFYLKAANNNDQTANNVLVSIFTGVQGTNYKHLAIEHLLVSDWPRSHGLVHVQCRSAILVLFDLLRHITYPPLLPELVVLIVKELIVVWPGMHYEGNVIMTKKK